MEWKEIRELLEKYYNGESTIGEERWLRDFFRTATGLPADLEAERALFGLMDESAADEPAPGFESRLVRKIFDNHPGRVRGMIRLRYVISAAAVAALLAGTIWLALSRGARHQDTYDNPALALAEVKKTLFMVSEIMNEGTAPMENIRYLNPPRELKSLGSISRGVSTMNRLESINIVYEKMSTIGKIDQIQEQVKRK